MSVPCCICWDRQWHLCESGSIPWGCLEFETAEACRGAGGLPGIDGAHCWELGGCWKCANPVPPDTHSDDGCCITLGNEDFWYGQPGYDEYEIRRIWANCEFCGGDLSKASECGDVEPPEHLEGCVRARENARLPRGALPWTIDLCGAALFGLEVLPEEANTPGEATALSAHPVRAMPTPGGQTECRKHRAYIGMMPNGDCAGVYCNEATAGNAETHWAPLYVEDEEDGMFVQYSTERKERPIPIGDAGFLGTMQLPPWTELDYRNAQMLCGIYE